MSLDSLINSNEVLCAVFRYQLNREEGRVIIDCFEVLAGAGQAPFIAIPYLTSLGTAKEQFYGFGETKEDALRECLTKIKKHNYEDVTGIESS
ncbi:hypothetical protein ACKFKF_22380 [Phormidesmis sp. 146-12]